MKSDYSNQVGGFTKLFSSIVHSTVWREAMHVKVVWVTMLALADRNGYVGVSLPGLADASRVTIELCQDAITRLMATDEYSRTKDHEGRRIEATDGGWTLLNYLKYREKRDQDERRLQVREAVQRHRAKATVSQSNPRKPKKAQAEAYAEADSRGKEESRSDSSAPQADAKPPVLTFPCSGDPVTWNLTVGQVATWTLLYPGVAVETECRKALAWILANSKKTAGGMERFLVRWLGRATDRGNAPNRSNGAAERPVRNWAEEREQATIAEAMRRDNDRRRKI